ncbi:MAG: hypothetical protein OXU51_14015 [Candidatus Poribacteria bacterium]|nr:hypothetical protein [Candidatus Poribacteria bacterium]
MRNKFNKRLKIPWIAKSLSKEAYRSLDLSAFLREIQLGIMPIGGESDRVPEFTVDIQVGPNDEPRVLTILESLPRRYQYGAYSWRNLEELLSDAVEKFALELVWAGCSIHKIFWDEENGGVYHLHSFRYEWLFRVFGKYRWIIPKADRHLYDKVYGVVPEKDIWNIVMPKALGGYRGYRAMLKWFASFSNIKDAEFLVAKITKQWGWINDSKGNCNEFYYVYRILRWQWAQACLREHIVKELNQLFCRLDIEAEIVVKGLPTAQKILKIRQQMAEGEISFSDALDACWL